MTVKTYITPTISAEMNESSLFNEFVRKSIHRHLSGDWGEISVEDAANNNAQPFYAFSSYTLDECKIWVKQDENILTVMFPAEY